MKVSEILEAVAYILERDNEGELLNKDLFKRGQERKYLISACHPQAMPSNVREVLNNHYATDLIREASKQVKLMEMLDAPTESTK
ncbi:hypothetical protein [Vibrio phage PJN101]|nr:hypothetical protein [Vibrio phage PJN101]